MCLGSTEALAPRRHYSMQLTVHRVRGLSVASGVSPFFAPPFGFCPAKRCTPPFSLPFCFRKLSMPVRLPSPFRLSLLALALTAAMHTTAVSGKDTSLPDNASQSVNAGQPDAASDAAGSQSATSSSTADPTAAGNGTATSGASSDLQSCQGQGRFVLGEELPKKRSAGDKATGATGAGSPRNGQGQNPEAGSDQAVSSNGAGGHGASSSTQGSAYPEMDWEKLIPPNWEPLKDFKSLNFSGMSDNDPRAIAALRKLQKAWKNAPLNPAIQQEKITISGFIVPLDSSDSTTIEEFLLVPYFGACIHVPPPPSNQVIHVVPEKPLKGFQIMDPVTVQGVLAPSHIDTPLGSAGYQMSGKSVTLYEAEDMQEAKPAHP